MNAVRRFHVAAWAVGLATLLLVGCQMMGSSGLPADKYLVGGGFKVQYIAPTDGTAIWANRATGQILITKSLQAGQEFDETGSPTDLKPLIGPDPSAARLVLYFVPRSTPVPADKHH